MTRLQVLAVVLAIGDLDLDGHVLGIVAVLCLAADMLPDRPLRRQESLR